VEEAEGERERENESRMRIISESDYRISRQNGIRMKRIWNNNRMESGRPSESSG